MNPFTLNSMSSGPLAPHRLLLLAGALAALIGLSACGSDDGSAAAATDVTVGQAEGDDESRDDEHGDDESADEHGDDESADEHGDDESADEHGDDESHDDEHSDASHDDEHSGDDESADEHGDDESHDDEHDDDGDHDDESHDDEHDDHDDESSAGLGAHEHGTAELSVAWIDGDVAIDLISPLFNVFGFEYEPTTDEDLAVADDRTAALSGAGIITINADAGCSLTEPISTEIERDGSHSEVAASWLFSCDEPGEIAEIDATGLFAEFPNFEDIDAQWISATDQSAAELTPSSPTLRLQS